MGRVFRAVLMAAMAPRVNSVGDVGVVGRVRVPTGFNFCLFFGGIRGNFDLEIYPMWHFEETIDLDPSSQNFGSI